MSMTGPAAEGQKRTATVRYGVYNQQLPVVGRTVGDVKKILKDQWQVPADAVAFSGKTQLSDDHLIEGGEELELQRRTGEKGREGLLAF